jgi:hypothetical protein
LRGTSKRASSQLRMRWRARFAARLRKTTPGTRWNVITPRQRAFTLGSACQCEDRRPRFGSSWHRRPTTTSMTIKDELHRVVNELDRNSAESSARLLHTLRRRRMPGEACVDDAAGIGVEETATLCAWENEGGCQAGHAVDALASAPQRWSLMTVERTGITRSMCSTRTQLRRGAPAG